MEIKNSYLMWVGSEHYGTIEEWINEAKEHGVSKRLPGAAIGSKMMEGDTVIFVAHDEGMYSDCEHCLGPIDCPDCRKRAEEMNRLEAEVERVLRRFEDEDDFETFASASQQRSVRIRREKLERLQKESDECTLCAGKAVIDKAGTGGKVVMEDGTALDYRTYNYWLHQPKKFDADKVKHKEMCEHCGGTGKIPDAKVFGMFVPSNIEYILKGGEDADAMKKVKDFVHVDASVIKTEPKRGCGKRKAGGVYAVTSPGGKGKKAKAKLKDMVKAGVIEPEATDVHGDFVEFLAPFEVDVKRFRGIKSWSLNPDVEEAAEDILDAIA